MMKLIRRWAVCWFLSILATSGAGDVFWPFLQHFQHGEIHLPWLVDFMIQNLLIPFGITVIFTRSMQDGLLESPWPFITAPAVSLIIVGFLNDSFFPPYENELFTVILAGLIRGISAAIAWLLYRRKSQQLLPGPGIEE
jgi:hypothetical protein